MYANVNVLPYLDACFDKYSVDVDSLSFLFTDINPLRTGADAFSQNNNAFYIAYWFTWAITTPFFIAIISRGRKVNLKKGEKYGNLK